MDAMENAPFVAGEKLHYNVYIKGIYCGFQVLHMIGEEEIDGRKVYHARITMETSKALTLLINYQEVLDLYLDPEELYPVKSYSVAYDRKKKEIEEMVFYPGGKIIKTVTEDGTTQQKEYQAPPKVQEGFSLFYFLRAWPWTPEFSLQFSFISSRGNITNVSITNPRKETVSVPAGKYQCYYLNDPSIPCSLWISEGKERLPVRIFNRRPFGIVESRLVKVE